MSIRLSKSSPPLEGLSGQVQPGALRKLQWLYTWFQLPLIIKIAHCGSCLLPVLEELDTTITDHGT